MKFKKTVILLVLFMFLLNIAAFCAATDKEKYAMHITILKNAWKDYTAKKYDSAYEKFQEVNKGYPAWAEPYDGMGWCMYQKAKYPEAEQLFNKALKIEPAYSSSLNGLYYVSLWRYETSNKAWNLYWRGKYGDAIKVFEEVLNQKTAQYPPQEMWSVHDGLGWSHYFKKDYKSSEAEFSKALKLLPDYADAQKGLGFTAYKNADYKKAIKYLTRASEYYYLDLSIKTTLAWSYYKSGSPKEAKGIFSYALQISPDYVLDKELRELIKNEKSFITLYNDVGWGYYGLGKYTEAKKEFEKVLKEEPDNYVSLTGLGYIKYKEKKYDGSIELITKALKIHPEPFPVNEAVAIPDAVGVYHIVSDGYTTLGWSYFYKGSYDKAESFFKKAISKNNWVDAHDGLGWTYLKKKKNDLAEKEFLAALNWYPGYASSIMGLNEVNSERYAASNKAWTFYYKGDFKAAAEHFKKVIGDKLSLYPKDKMWILYDGIGWASYFLKDYDAAIKNFQKSIELFSQSADSYSGLGWSYLKKGIKSKAEKSFTDALKLYPRYYSAMEGLEELKKPKK